MQSEAVFPLTQPVQARRRPVPHAAFFQLAFGSAAVLTLLLFLEDLRTLDIQLLCNLSTVAMLLIGWWMFRLAPRGWWSPSLMYFAVFCLFHFGMTFVTGLNAPIYRDFERNRERWFFTEFTSEAVVLATIAMLAIALGVRVGLMGRTGRLDEQSDPRDEKIGHGFVVVGVVLMALSISAWFFLVLSSGGTSLLLGAYRALLDELADDSWSTTLIHYSVAVAAIFLAAGPSSSLRRAGFWIFIVWAVFALPLGLRGRVLFPLCTALIVAAWRKPPFTGRRATVIAVLGMVFALSAIAFIRGYRQAGLVGLGQSEIRFSPLDGLAEMGASIRPVSLVVQWRAEGDGFIYGASYWAPFDRALGRLVPGWEVDRLPAEHDDRLMNTLISHRHAGAGLGFSPVAEAYRNFGPPGVPLVMFVIGFILGRVDRWRPTRMHMVLTGLVFYPLLYQVRNAFVQLPAQFLIGCAIMLVTVLVARAAHFSPKSKVQSPRPA